MTAGNFAEESDSNDLERHDRSLQYTEDPYIKEEASVVQPRLCLGPVTNQHDVMAAVGGALPSQVGPPAMLRFVPFSCRQLAPDVWIT
ncbi:MAG: hypothetical protein JWP57_3992 [Spirosoma sp.]|nr:hypothetical protein [Spirosoma sp.]